MQKNIKLYISHKEFKPLSSNPSLKRNVFEIYELIIDF